MIKNTEGEKAMLTKELRGNKFRGLLDERVHSV